MDVLFPKLTLSDFCDFPSICIRQKLASFFAIHNAWNYNIDNLAYKSDIVC